MNNEEVELVPWLRDRIRGLPGEEIKETLEEVHKDFIVPHPSHTAAGCYLINISGELLLGDIYQVVSWGERTGLVNVRRERTSEVCCFLPGRFLKVPEKYLQFKKEGDRMREDTTDSMSMSLKGFKPGEIEFYVGGLKGPKSAVGVSDKVGQEMEAVGVPKVRFTPGALNMIKSLLPIAPDVRTWKLLERGFKRISPTTADAGDYVMDIMGNYGNLLQIKKWWSPDTILVLDEKGGECVYHPDSLLRVPNYHLQSVEPILLTAEHQRVPEVGERYTIGIDPAAEESVATYYMGKECAPVYRSPKSFVCEYGGQSLTFNEVGCTIDKQDYVVCPTTGRKLNPNTLLPIEEHVDFTTRGIL